MTEHADDPARRPPPPVDWAGVKGIHLMGVCGSAMGALAVMLHKSGYKVRGSDRGAYPPMSTTLAAHGVHIYEGYRADNLAWGPDVVVVGNVIRPDFEEAVALRARGLPHCSLPQALTALFIGDRHSVVVTGTHGKTTTSAMAAWLLHEAGLDPGFMIGGVTGNFGANHRVSDGPVFVVEGDEYDTAYFDKGPKFLHYRPRTASLNNIEFDHADIFADLATVKRTFARLMQILPPDGRLVVNHDDLNAREVARECRAPQWTFGLSPHAHIRAEEVHADDRGTAMTLSLPGAAPHRLRLPLWGEHNVLNALTASGLAYAAGAAPAAIAGALETFVLPVKRQQLRGIADGVPVIDDFAHHPTAIRETLRAMRHAGSWRCSRSSRTPRGAACSRPTSPEPSARPTACGSAAPTPRPTTCRPKRAWTWTSSSPISAPPARRWTSSPRSTRWPTP
jgi:UDP-N-acetylmuramate: L-alanyl-gamma-D-glutamyl-meso-diaminopimelate ligase